MRDVKLPSPTDITGTRSRPMTDLQARPPAGPVRIVFLSANTKDGDQLAIDDEYRSIEQQIRLARHRDTFQLISKPAARRSDLQNALLQHTPHVVHFACHGSSQAEIVLHSDGQGFDPMSSESLATLFDVLHDDLVLVLFNACFASAQASAIRRSARVTIGMRARIEDKSAIAFAAALYGALAYGRSVREAFDLGVAALDSHQCDLPELFTRPGVDASNVYLVERRRFRAPHVGLAALLACAALVVGWRSLAPVSLASRDAIGGTASAASSVAGPDMPFVLEAGLRVHRIRDGQPITLDDVRSGDIVMDGDRLQLSVRTSRDAYLYLAFCSQQAKAPQYRGLDVFPEQGGIPMVANQSTVAPAKNADIVLDDQQGLETLYVIMSRNELSHADAHLAGVIAAARRGREGSDCGVPLQGALGGPRKTATARRVWNGGHLGAGPKAITLMQSLDAGKPVAEIERGGGGVFGGAQSGIEADPDGIVVLRYELEHVSAAVR